NRDWSASARRRSNSKPKPRRRLRPNRQSRSAIAAAANRSIRREQSNPQRNFTDPDSRIMIGRYGFIQAYNAQAAVDRRRQIILAHRLSNNPDDHAALVPDAAKANAGRKPVEISGDA